MSNNKANTKVTNRTGQYVLLYQHLGSSCWTPTESQLSLFPLLCYSVSYFLACLKLYPLGVHLYTALFSFACLWTLHKWNHNAWRLLHLSAFVGHGLWDSSMLLRIAVYFRYCRIPFMNSLRFIYPFCYQWALGLFSVWDYCEHSYMYILLYMCPDFWGIYLVMELLGEKSRHIFFCTILCWTVFQSGH